MMSNEIEQDKFDTILAMFYKSQIYDNLNNDFKQIIQQTISENFKQLPDYLLERGYENQIYLSYARNIFNQYIELLKGEENPIQGIKIIFDQYARSQKNLQAIIISRLPELINSLILVSNNPSLIEVLLSYAEKSTSIYYNLFNIFVEVFAKNEQKLAQEFIDACLKISKLAKNSDILSPIVFQLTYDQIKEHLPLIVASPEETIDIKFIIEQLNTLYSKEQDKIMEILYLILKQRNDQPYFLKRLKQISEFSVQTFKQESIFKLIERLIKNEKWHCKIMISLILFLIKHSSKDSKANEQTLKECQGLIKKILKKEVWKIKDKKNEDWICLMKGLSIFFANNQSRDTYSLFKSYISSNIREEMIKDYEPLKSFVNAYSKK